MIQEERLVKILSIINENKFVTAEELKNLLYISLSTIRRDLAELNKRGLIIRSHGGAIVKSESETTEHISIETDALSTAKTAIAKRAAEFVNDGDTIFMAASSTVSLMTRFLADKKDITVVTNSLSTVWKLSENKIRVYCCGGNFDEQSNALSGNAAIEFIDSFNYDMTFFSCDAISPLGDICIGYKFTPIVKAAMQRSQKSVCLCDSGKFGKHSIYNSFNANRIDLLITDSIEVPRVFWQKTVKV